MSERKTLTFDDLKALNDENYDPADIRTYTCKAICGSPTREVQAHMALSGHGDSIGGSSYNTNIGSFLGHSSVEFIEKVAGMILHFPKASQFNQLKAIKTAKLPSFYPSWLIERYELFDEVERHHKMPVFYDASIHKFVVFLDEGFYRDLSPSAINFKDVPNFRIIHDKKKKPHGAFVADTYRELTEEVLDTQKRRDCDDSPFLQAKKLYRRHFVSAAQGERVICVAIEHEEGADGKYRMLSSVHSYSSTNMLVELVRHQRSSFELYQGALIDDTIFLMDDDGVLHPDVMVEATKLRRQKAKANPHSLRTETEFTYFTIPYTDEDWKLLTSIHERLKSLMTELECFFASGALPDARYDKPIAELTAAPAFLGLTDGRN